MNLKLDIQKIKDFIENDEFFITKHARLRMFERNISTDIVKNIVLDGEIIEQYNEDEPCPSCLLLGFMNKTPFHIVIAQCIDHIRIITIYRPDRKKWINYKKRKG